MIHEEPSTFAGKTVTLETKDDRLNGQQFKVEDWWDRVSGGSWMHADGNPACIGFAIRSARAGLPTDNEVLYGKVGFLGYLVHVSEVRELTTPTNEEN